MGPSRLPLKGLDAPADRNIPAEQRHLQGAAGGTTTDSCDRVDARGVALTFADEIQRLTLNSAGTTTLSYAAAAGGNYAAANGTITWGNEQQVLTKNVAAAATQLSYATTLGTFLPGYTGTTTFQAGSLLTLSNTTTATDVQNNLRSI